MNIQTNSEALTLALTLAINATTDEQAEECVTYAETIASTMTKKQVAICQKAAECAVEYQQTYGV